MDDHSGSGGAMGDSPAHASDKPPPTKRLCGDSSVRRFDEGQSTDKCQGQPPLVGQTTGIPLVGQTAGGERAGSSNCLPAACSGSDIMASVGFADTLTFRLSDFLPRGVQESNLFGPESVAHHELRCTRVHERMAGVMQQMLARDALNQAALLLGRDSESSLAAAITVGLELQTINRRQAAYLRKVNTEANDAKHGTWFVPMAD